jgi:linoleoyl-CoA desaturase
MNLGQPIYNALLATFFQYGVAFHDLDFEEIRKGTKDKQLLKVQIGQLKKKFARQLGKDYVVFPLLTGPAARSTFTANLTANLIRNLWTYSVIFCGHFPDGAQVFTADELEHETPHEWYLRQLLGSANFDSGPILDFMTGNLSHQIEHHLFPDLPSNRYSEISVRVRALCDKYELPYTTGPFHRQLGQTLRTITRLSLPGGNGVK